MFLNSFNHTKYRRYNQTTSHFNYPAGIAGNILEWYDFAVYGFFAPVFAKLFFPSKDPTVSLIAAFGAFAIGFLMRPVGAAFFGYLRIFGIFANSNGEHSGKRVRRKL